MKINFLLKYVVSFILFVSIYILVLGVTIKLTIFNESYLKERLASNNYYQLLYDKVQEEMSYYITQSGLEEDVIKDIVKVNKIQEDTNNVIQSIYDNKEYIIDTYEIEKKLNENINLYLVNKNIKVDSQKDLDNFVLSISDVYKNSVSIDFFSNYLFIHSNNLNSLLMISSTFIFTSFIFLRFVLNQKNLISVFMSVGFTLLLTVFLIKENINIENILFYSSEFSLIIRNVFLDIIHIFNLVSVFLLNFSIFLIIFKEFIKRKSNNSN